MNAVVVARLWTSRLRTAIVSWRSEEMENRFVAADVVIYDIHRPAGSDGPETFYSVFFLFAASLVHLAANLLLSAGRDINISSAPILTR